MAQGHAFVLRYSTYFVDKCVLACINTIFQLLLLLLFIFKKFTLTWMNILKF